LGESYWYYVVAHGQRPDSAKSNLLGTVTATQYIKDLFNIREVQIKNGVPLVNGITNSFIIDSFYAQPDFDGQGWTINMNVFNRTGSCSEASMDAVMNIYDSKKQLKECIILPGISTPSDSLGYLISGGVTIYTQITDQYKRADIRSPMAGATKLTPITNLHVNNGDYIQLTKTDSNALAYSAFNLVLELAGCSKKDIFTGKEAEEKFIRKLADELGKESSKKLLVDIMDNNGIQPEEYGELWALLKDTVVNALSDEAKSVIMKKLIKNGILDKASEAVPLYNVIKYRDEISKWSHIVEKAQEMYRAMVDKSVKDNDILIIVPPASSEGNSIQNAVSQNPATSSTNEGNKVRDIITKGGARIELIIKGDMAQAIKDLRYQAQRLGYKDVVIQQRGLDRLVMDIIGSKLDESLFGALINPFINQVTVLSYQHIPPQHYEGNNQNDIYTRGGIRAVLEVLKVPGVNENVEEVVKNLRDRARRLGYYNIVIYQIGTRRIVLDIIGNIPNPESQIRNLIEPGQDLHQKLNIMEKCVIKKE
jgi:hypothetical protein